MKDILFNIDDEAEILATHWAFAVQTMRRFSEFQVLYEHYPWRFALLLDDNDSVVQQTLLHMKEEWTLLMDLEARCDGASSVWPLKQLPHTRWYSYREVFTYAAERQFQKSEGLLELVRAWQPNPSSTLGNEDRFSGLATG